MSQAYKAINLAIRFLLEVCMLAALVYWGFKTGNGLVLKMLLGVGIPVVAAVIWGTFRVPNDPGNAPVAVPGLLRLLLELTLFGLATASLVATGHLILAWAFGLAVISNYSMLYERLIWLLKQR